MAYISRRVVSGDAASHVPTKSSCSHNALQKACNLYTCTCMDVDLQERVSYTGVNANKLVGIQPNTRLWERNTDFQSAADFMSETLCAQNGQRNSSPVKC